MLGSSFSVSGPNTVLNTIVADVLSVFADELEVSEKFKDALNILIRKTIKEHKRIIFNGNNYSEEWVKEAEKRGLLNLKSTVDALPMFISEKNIQLFTKHHVYTKSEMMSRYIINLENYTKTVHIEALTMLNMAKKDIIPSSISFQDELLRVLSAKKTLNMGINSDVEETLLKKASSLTENIYKKVEELENAVLDSKNITDHLEKAKYYRNTVIPYMNALRVCSDELETVVAKKYWPFPTYEDLLFSVKM
jgi:glutamine synthetase